MVTKILQKRRAHLYIEEWMEHLNLSYETLGGRLNVSRTTVWRWATQQHRLTPEKIAALAEAMGLHPEDLWRPPSRPSLDAMVADAPDAIFESVKTLIQSLTRKAS